LMYHTYCWGSYFYLSWLHTYLQKGRGLTEGEMAVFSTLPFLAGACGNLFGGWLSDRLVKSHGVKLGRRIVGTAGLALSAAVMLGAAVTPDKRRAGLFLALGDGARGCIAPVSWGGWLGGGGKMAGTVSGTMNMAGQVGSFASSVAFGYLVTYFGGYNAPLFPMAALLLISALLFSRIDPTEQLAEQLAPALT